MLKAIRASMEQELFHPGLIGIWVNPFYHARRALRSEIESLAHCVAGRVLDVGCGSKPYRDLIVCEEYIGLEVDTRETRARGIADIYYSGTRIPAEDNNFDWVICNQVFEHVFEPAEFLAEIRRVLKPGGGLLLTVPFVWDEHEQPQDFARYSSFGLKALVEAQGLEVVEQRKTLADIRVIFQLINGYLYKVTRTKNPYINIGVCALLMAPFSILGILLYRILPGNEDLYLDNVLVARCPSGQTHKT